MILELANLNKGQSRSILGLACLKCSPSICRAAQVRELESFITCLSQSYSNDRQPEPRPAHQAPASTR